MIKKLYTTLFSFVFLTALFFLLSSCGEDNVHLRIEDKKEEKKDERVPLDLSGAEFEADDWSKGKQSGTPEPDDNKKTRVSATGFEDGDELWIWAVKRNGNQKGTLLNKGNYADARLHYFQSGGLVPATPEDRLYVHPVDKIDIYYLHIGNRQDIDIKGQGLKALENVTFIQENTTQKEFEKNLFLWGKGKEEGYDYQNKKLGKTTFLREVTLFTATTEKLPNRSLDDIYLEVNVNSATFSPLTGCVSSSMVGTNKLFRMFPSSESSDTKVFVCMLPANCQVTNVHFHDNNKGVKKVVTQQPAGVTNVGLLKNQNNRLRVTYLKDVITWEYEFRYDETLLQEVTDLGNNVDYFLINSRGEERTMTITSLRKELKNGVPTGKIENVPYTITFEGQDANVFRVDGNRIGAIENTSNKRKFGVAVITQDGGDTISFDVLQEGKVSVIVNT